MVVKALAPSAVVVSIGVGPSGAMYKAHFQKLLLLTTVLLVLRSIENVRLSPALVLKLLDRTAAQGDAVRLVVVQTGEGVVEPGDVFFNAFRAPGRWLRCRRRLGRCRAGRN